MRKLYELGIQRSRLLYARMERVLNELYTKYPALKKEAKLKDMADKFRSIATGKDVASSFNSSPQPRPNEDPIKKLLNNIITYIGNKKDTKSMRRNASVGSAIDAISNEYTTTPSKSGFDINEALNPTDSLEEILKSFNLNREAE